MTDMEVFITRLKSARLMKGYSMDELCEKMSPKVSKMTISKYESGAMQPNSTTLLSIAKALEQPIDYFFRPITFNLGTVKFRKKSSVSQKEIKSIEQTIVDKVERYICVEEICNDVSVSAELKKYPVANKDDAKRVAQELRKKWNLGIDGIPNVIDLLEEHGYKIVEIEAPENFDGMSSAENSKYPIIVIRRSKNAERTRFTSLHELGHLIMRFDPSLSPKDEEILCNLFANEMLIPESEMKRILGISRKSISYKEMSPLQIRFGISYDALMFKASECGVITPQCYKWYNIHKNQDPSYKQFVEKALCREEKSNRFTSLVYKALYSELITISKAANLLRINIEDVREGYALA
ncbi:MAG: ImmA/IrrE family metallo-endopeptidase [Fibrobacteraceae bacterium]|nr:ImmA/IrrE family metallo-endopeptidase [Fibrobacteraceae bacterium]